MVVTLSLARGQHDAPPAATMGMLIAHRPSAVDRFVSEEFLDEIARDGGAGVAGALASDVKFLWDGFLVDDLARRREEDRVLDLRASLAAAVFDRDLTAGEEELPADLDAFWSEHRRVCDARMSRVRDAVRELGEIALSHGLNEIEVESALQRALAVCWLEFGAHDYGPTRHLQVPAAHCEFATVILEAMQEFAVVGSNITATELRAQHELVRSYELEVGGEQFKRIRAAAALGDARQSNRLDGVRTSGHKAHMAAEWSVYQAQRRWIAQFSTSLHPSLWVRVEAQLWRRFSPSLIPDSSCHIGLLEHLVVSCTDDASTRDELIAITGWYRDAYRAAMQALLRVDHDSKRSRALPTGAPIPDRAAADDALVDAVDARARTNEQCLVRLISIFGRSDATVVAQLLADHVEKFSSDDDVRFERAASEGTVPFELSRRVQSEADALTRDRSALEKLFLQFSQQAAREESRRIWIDEATRRSGPLPAPSSSLK